MAPFKRSSFTISSFPLPAKYKRCLLLSLALLTVLLFQFALTTPGERRLYQSKGDVERQAILEAKHVYRQTRLIDVSKLDPAIVQQYTPEKLQHVYDLHFGAAGRKAIVTTSSLSRGFGRKNVFRRQEKFMYLIVEIEGDLPRRMSIVASALAVAIKERRKLIINWKTVEGVFEAQFWQLFDRSNSPGTSNTAGSGLRKMLKRRFDVVDDLDMRDFVATVPSKRREEDSGRNVPLSAHVPPLIHGAGIRGFEVYTSEMPIDDTPSSFSSSSRYRGTEGNQVLSVPFATESHIYIRTSVPIRSDWSCRVFSTKESRRATMLEDEKMMRRLEGEMHRILIPHCKVRALISSVIPSASSDAGWGIPVEEQIVGVEARDVSGSSRPSHLYGTSGNEVHRYEEDDQLEFGDGRSSAEESFLRLGPMNALRRTVKDVLSELKGKEANSAAGGQTSPIMTFDGPIDVLGSIDRPPTQSLIFVSSDSVRTTRSLLSLPGSERIVFIESDGCASDSPGSLECLRRQLADIWILSSAKTLIGFSSSSVLPIATRMYESSKKYVDTPEIRLVDDPTPGQPRTFVDVDAGEGAFAEDAVFDVDEVRNIHDGSKRDDQRQPVDIARLLEELGSMRSSTTQSRFVLLDTGGNGLNPDADSDDDLTLFERVLQEVEPNPGGEKTYDKIRNDFDGYEDGGFYDDDGDDEDDDSLYEPDDSDEVILYSEEDEQSET